MQYVHNWFLRNGLAIGHDKTEIILLGSAHRLAHVGNPAVVNVVGCTISPVSSVKNIGDVLDCHMSFDLDVNKICQSCYFHIMALRHVRPSLTFDTAHTVASAIVCSQLIYDISLL